MNMVETIYYDWRKATQQTIERTWRKRGYTLLQYGARVQADGTIRQYVVVRKVDA